MDVLENILNSLCDDRLILADDLKEMDNVYNNILVDNESDSDHLAEMQRNYYSLKRRAVNTLTRYDVIEQKTEMLIAEIKSAAK